MINKITSKTDKLHFRRCIPEFIVENTIGFLCFLRRLSPNTFEEQGSSFLNPILTEVSDVRKYVNKYRENEWSLIVRNPDKIFDIFLCSGKAYNKDKMGVYHHRIIKLYIDFSFRL